ncbi:MAG: UPF0175 family protein [Saprospiraceae bacterium]|nr:UPF0175 family protein [Saprospiraceae bacterium]
MTTIAENRPLVIPPDVLQSIGLSEQSIKLELAIIFYKEFQLSSGKAARFAGISRVAFLHELGLRKIAINYDEADAQHDVEAINEFNKNSPQSPNDCRQRYHGHLHLLQIGELDMLQRLFGVVVIPDKVLDELKALTKFGVDVSALQASSWLLVKSPVKSDLLLRLETTLDEGEANAIALAVELSADLLLMDETEGRKAAQALNLPFTGGRWGAHPCQGRRTDNLGRHFP